MQHLNTPAEIRDEIEAIDKQLDRFCAFNQVTRGAIADELSTARQMFQRRNALVNRLEQLNGAMT